MVRKYQLQRRAQRQEETRQRIVEAAIQLHQTIGARTTIKAVAELAGVERLTVYRHFPDERSLLMACTSHYQAQNPPPDIDSWQHIEDAEQRLRSALTEIYVYHRRTEQMSAHTVSGVEEVPALREVLAPYFAYWEQVREVLAAAWEPPNPERAKRIRAAVGHAISFQTWRSLAREQGLEDTEAVELMAGMVCCLCRS